MVGAANWTYAWHCLALWVLSSAQTSHCCCLFGSYYSLVAQRVYWDAMRISWLALARFRSSHPQWRSAWSGNWDNHWMINWHRKNDMTNSWFSVFLPEILMNFENCPHQKHQFPVAPTLPSQPVSSAANVPRWSYPNLETAWLPIC
jgi:hypothetical protein